MSRPDPNLILISEDNKLRQSEPDEHSMVEEYYNRFNPDLLSALPSEASLIVEVGCGAGALGYKHKQKVPDCRYIGIEQNSDAARTAESRLDQVLFGDVETLSNQDFDFQGSVDCLVYGDVLEHLIDPWEVVKKQVDWLRDGGQVVACVPNIQTWPVLVGLLKGEWEYTDEGTLDRTHLRFFTRKSVVSMFENAGLEIEEVNARQYPVSGIESLEELIIPLLDVLEENPEDFLRAARTLQYVVQARKIK